MTDNRGFRWRRAKDNRGLSDIEEMGWALRPRVRDIIGTRWERRLLHIRNGKQIDRGPWRKGNDAVVAFSNTIENNGRVGDVFRFVGHVRRVGRVVIVRYFPGLRALDFCQRMIGTPYVFGAQNGPNDEGPNRFDCSGLFCEAWQVAAGVALPHSAEAIRLWGLQNGKMVHGLENAREGDGILFNFPNSRGLEWPQASHIGTFREHAHFVGHESVPATVVDTRSPFGEPVAVRAIELDRVVGIVRPRA